MHTALSRAERLAQLHSNTDDATSDTPSSTPPYRSYQTMLSRLAFFLPNMYTWNPDPELRPKGTVAASLEQLYVPRHMAQTLAADISNAENTFDMCICNNNRSHSITVHVRPSGGYHFQTNWKIWEKTHIKSSNTMCCPLKCIVHSNVSADQTEEAYTCMILWSGIQCDPSMFGIVKAQNTQNEEMTFDEDKRPYIDPYFLYNEKHAFDAEFKTSWHIANYDTNNVQTLNDHDVVVWHDCVLSAPVFQVAWWAFRRTEPAAYIECKLFCKSGSSHISMNGYVCVMRTKHGKGDYCKNEIATFSNSKLPFPQVDLRRGADTSASTCKPLNPPVYTKEICTAPTLSFTPHVCIYGAGPAGLLTAYFLASLDGTIRQIEIREKRSCDAAFIRNSLLQMRGGTKIDMFFKNVLNMDIKQFTCVRTADLQLALVRKLRKMNNVHISYGSPVVKYDTNDDNKVYIDATGGNLDPLPQKKIINPSYILLAYARIHDKNTKRSIQNTAERRDTSAFEEQNIINEGDHKIIPYRFDKQNEYFYCVLPIKESYTTTIGRQFAANSDTIIPLPNDLDVVDRTLKKVYPGFCLIRDGHRELDHPRILRIRSKEKGKVLDTKIYRVGDSAQSPNWVLGEGLIISILTSYAVAKRIVDDNWPLININGKQVDLVTNDALNNKFIPAFNINDNQIYETIGSIVESIISEVNTLSGHELK
jgi:hypothetical protein